MLWRASTIASARGTTSGSEAAASSKNCATPPASSLQPQLPKRMAETMINAVRRIGRAWGTLGPGLLLAASVLFLWSLLA